jgi:hypothetical protein
MYSNNADYRSFFRAFFKMDTKALEVKYAYLKESDPESYDEMLYDDEAVKKGTDILYDTTKDNPRFRELYRIAAGRFLSEDLEIGLCVLLTYDFFGDFIALYENPTDESLWETLQAKL